MEDGPPNFPQGFTCPVVLRIRLALLPFRLRGCHPLWPFFPKRSARINCTISQSYYPAYAVTYTVWAPSISLAATLEIDVSFFSSSYLDVSVQRVGPPFGALGLLPNRLSHSDIPGSLLVCKSPGLFAAYHVLLRLQEPRHPPYALYYFLTNHYTFPIVKV